MVVTANKMDVPEPKVPIKSLKTDKAPMQAPPKAAAVGMIFFNSLVEFGVPSTQKLDSQVVGPSHVKELRQQEDVGRQRTAQHDRDVGGVEQSDRVQAVRASASSRFDRQLNSESLQVDHSKEDDNSGNQLEHVGAGGSVEGFDQSSSFVLSGAQKMEQRDNGTVKLGTLANIGGGGRESFPEHLFTDVSGGEQRDTGAQTVALAQELIQQNDNNTGENQAQNQQQTHSKAQSRRRTVHAGQNVDSGAANRQNNSEQFASGAKALSVLFIGHVHQDQLGSAQQAEHHTGGHDRRDTQLHQRTSVGGQHHSQPEQRITAVRRHNSVQGNLRHDQEDKQGDPGPHDLAAERHFSLGRYNLRHKGSERTNQVQHTESAHDKQSNIVAAITKHGRH